MKGNEPKISSMQTNVLLSRYANKLFKPLIQRIHKAIRKPPEEEQSSDLAQRPNRFSHIERQGRLRPPDIEECWWAIVRTKASRGSGGVDQTRCRGGITCGADAAWEYFGNERFYHRD